MRRTGLRYATGIVVALQVLAGPAAATDSANETDRAPRRGYRPEVDRTLLLDARLAKPESLAASKLRRAEGGDVALPAGAPEGSLVFEATERENDTAPREGKVRSGWVAAASPALALDASGYNRLSFWVYVREGRFAMLTVQVHSQEKTVNSLLPAKRQRIFSRRTINGGQWQKITLDMHHSMEAWRATFTGFDVSARYMYIEDGESYDHYGMFLAGVQLQHVANPRKWHGWNPDPQVITVNQIGYKPLSPKVALADANHTPREFVVRDAATGKAIMRGTFETRSSRLTPYLAGDFTDLRTPGRYFIESGDVSSVAFNVADRPYDEVADAALKVLAGMRCGTRTMFHKRPCHLDDLWDVENSKSLDLACGYHDAADVLRQDHSQTTYQFTWHMRLYHMLPEDHPRRAALLDEAKWCLYTFDKHFKALGEIWNPQSGQYYLTDNIRGTADDRKLNGRRAGGMFYRAQVGFAGMIGAAGDAPEEAKRALEILRQDDNKKYIGYGGGLGITAGIMAYQALGKDDPLGEYGLRAALKKSEQILASQENRVFEGSDPCFSGLFAVTGKDPDAVYFEASYSSEWHYQEAVSGLAALMEALPDHPDWYTWYFALRRYADFYVKSADQFSAPYASPVNVLSAEQVGARKRYGVGPAKVGTIDGRPFYCWLPGRHIGDNKSLIGTNFCAWHWQRAAAALGDPQVEARALGIWGLNLGVNPHNWIRVAGFGEDPCEVVWSYYAMVPGLTTFYPNLYFYNRTVPLAHINECWTAAQMNVVLGAMSLGAPCVVSGVITDRGKPYVGPARIETLHGEKMVTFRTAADGSYGPVTLAGGDHVRLTVGPRSRRFAAVAGARPTVDFDVSWEGALRTAGVFVGGRQIRDPKRGFLHLPAGKAATVRLGITPGGAHVLRVHAANAAVKEAEIQVAADQEAVEFEITPQRAGETVCVLVEVDGDHNRKWELSAVAE